ncbi:hypothetical protein MAUB_47970 [Mycolicibacterium aubagnense]|uniref:Uncharacterized protein n=1 Tax=Mycolicibacterium aubagnense TaxID=319707 RepID=A0ABM7IJK8_9MYCO|nr:hypothetical protein MAUB_47970 [Mycolicibacterium aubagnense]
MIGPVTWWDRSEDQAADRHASRDTAKYVLEEIAVACFTGEEPSQLLDKCPALIPEAATKAAITVFCELPELLTVHSIDILDHRRDAIG